MLDILVIISVSLVTWY